MTTSYGNGVPLKVAVSSYWVRKESFARYGQSTKPTLKMTFTPGIMTTVSC